MYGMTDLEESSWTHITDSDLRPKYSTMASKQVSVFRSLDPVGTVLPWRSAIYRRKYNVATPN